MCQFNCYLQNAVSELNYCSEHGVSMKSTFQESLRGTTGVFFEKIVTDRKDIECIPSYSVSHADSEYSVSFA